MESLEKQIYELEKELLKPEIRMSQEKISELVAEDFFEFCSSGSIYHYYKGDIFIAESNLYEIKWEIRDFAIKQLSSECILATYKIIKHDEIDENIKPRLFIENQIFYCILLIIRFPLNSRHTNSVCLRIHWNLLIQNYTAHYSKSYE
ncbi:hypothetical protein [Abyssisolibacter fermentans]|uniref:hypothetical protein n=1 Tax=Abyssisolibacter fermentans TaxID=1766203 RepID=UPI0012E335D0|nr:hypothetical protein [Abyssisolibacter fermentans]